MTNTRPHPITRKKKQKTTINSNNNKQQQQQQQQTTNNKKGTVTKPTTKVIGNAHPRGCEQLRRTKVG